MDRVSQFVSSKLVGIQFTLGNVFIEEFPPLIVIVPAAIFSLKFFHVSVVWPSLRL